MRALRSGAAALVAALALAAPAARADDPSPVGRWTTIDDDTKKPTSVVAIWEEGGKLKGKVESLVLEPGEDPNPLCTKCEGARKDQPIVGMEIMWGLAREGRTARWSGGRILDPDDGSTYRCKLELVDGGQKLEVRGFIGFSLLGRTQVWLRAAP